MGACDRLVERMLEDRRALTAVTDQLSSRLAEVRFEFDAAFQDLVEVVRGAPEDECVGEGWAFRYADRTAGSHYPEHLPDLQKLLDG
jgi:hypothetical protein